MTRPPVQKFTLELLVDRGEEEVRCHRYVVDFHQPPTPETALPCIKEVFAAAITQALEAVEP